jgi:hypothetical protein
MQLLMPLEPMLRISFDRDVCTVTNLTFIFLSCHLISLRESISGPIAPVFADAPGANVKNQI